MLVTLPIAVAEIARYFTSLKPIKPLSQKSNREWVHGGISTNYPVATNYPVLLQQNSMTKSGKRKSVVKNLTTWS